MACHENILSIYKVKQDFKYAFLNKKLTLVYFKDDQLTFYDIKK